jgi:DNA-binding NtrC family response regulator
MRQILPGFRVLVADDDRLIAKTMSQILRLSGYEADAVFSGEEAVTVAAITRPDVFISDVLMDGITGIEAAIRILEIVPTCHVILISGHANIAHLDGVRRKAHEFEILAKPVHPKLLLEQIAAFASERTLAQVPNQLQSPALY